MTTSEPRLDAWSYSRLSTYRKCPKQSKLKDIDKVKVPGQKLGSALLRGREVHDYMQAVTTGKTPAKRREFQWGTTRVLEIAGRRDYDVERRWAVNKRWQRVEWFSDDAWCRIVVDFVGYDGDLRMLMVDYKTGKIREIDTKEQLSLYAVVGFALHPLVQEIVVEAWWLDHQHSLRRTYARKVDGILQEVWEQQARPLLEDRTFEATPGSHCRWCDFSHKHKGGPCTDG